MTRGKTPIKKNIRVIDAAGNEYEATYLKRAKGLAKNGRAIFIDEHTLCLDCPPNDNLEDKSMNNNFVQNTAEMEDRSNGPKPSTASKEWLKKVDIAAVVEHMNSGDIVELFKNLPEDVLEQVDYAAVAEHMHSSDLVELIKVLPDEQLKRLDVAEITEHMDSGDIVEFMKRLFR